VLALAACAGLLTAIGSFSAPDSTPSADARAPGSGVVADGARIRAAREPRTDAAAAAGGGYVPGEVLVRYGMGTRPGARASVARVAGAAGAIAIAPHTRLLHLKPGVSVPGALRRLRAERGVVWAAPDYRAREAGAFVPNDEGEPGAGLAGWEKLQWNFAGEFGVNAPEAWSNVNADGGAGGQGVIVAVLDTGVAYANRGPFRRSPDFHAGTFIKGYDFVDRSAYPYDRNGHGTFVASTIAEATDNHYGLTGLAYNARIMPVRVLDSQGEGEASTIAEGIRFAADHGAQVINMSLEFSGDVTAADIPELVEAIRYAHDRGVLLVAAAGNEGRETIPYPARSRDVIAVGATTEHGCLADYSNDGSGITLVAPGGGPDANLPGDPNCRPEAAPGRDIYQVTLGASPRQFTIPNYYEGTSMAAPHVSATAALIIASGVLGRHPTPAQLTARLKDTARRLGGGGDEDLYGAGLVNAAAATAPGGPGAVAP
jgi:serine protease